MTHDLPCLTPLTPRRSFLVALGLWAGLAALDVLAAPPAPVAPIMTSAATRFTDNGNGTITDSLTGLIWLKDANCFGSKNWADALSSANGLANGSCSLTDGSTAGQWRLPNRNELQSLIDYTKNSPALPAEHPFVGVQSSVYWSSTTTASDPSYAWSVHLSDGIVNANDKAGDISVWPVRGGQ